MNTTINRITARILTGLVLICLVTSSGFSQEVKPKIGMDLEGRTLGHFNVLIRHLEKQGELPKEVIAEREKRKSGAEEARKKTKEAYINLGRKMRPILTDPASTITEKNLASCQKTCQSGGGLSHAGFREQLALYQSLPDSMQAKFRNGDYDAFMPVRKEQSESRKKKLSNKASWMERNLARTAELNEEQTAKWNAIHEAYLAEMAEFTAGPMAKAGAKRNAALQCALIAGSEDDARAAYKADLDLQVKKSLMKWRQIRDLFKVLTDEQREKIVAQKKKAAEKQ